LPQFFADRLDGSIRTDSLPDAKERAERLIADALGSQPTPAPTPVSPTPTAPGTQNLRPTTPTPAQDSQ
jgi:protein phosphatase